MKRVYFIKPIGMDGPVKIGLSKSPVERLRNLEFWSPIPLEILASIPGDEIIERRFHAKFIDQHSHREWFGWSPALAGVISEIKAGTFDLDTLPDASGSYGVGLRRQRTAEERRGHGERMRAAWARRKAAA